MGQMYPRKPFAGFARPMDPDAVLRSVRAPSIPPGPEMPSPSISADASSASNADASPLAAFGEEFAAMADRFGISLKENTLTTLGTTLAIGIAIGAIFGSKIGRMAVLLAAGALLQNFAIPAGVQNTKDAARRSGA